MITDAEFLRIELEMGISLDNPAFLELGAATARQMSDLPVRSVLDFGAGTGVYSDAFHKAGYDVKACEKFKSHVEYMKNRVPHIEILGKPITTDLLVFIETSEHMTDKELDALFKKIQPSYILFSSTSQRTENDEAWGHINIKEQSEWDAYFLNKGYQLIRPLAYPTNWSKLYGKG
jgi:2-polyprenyl-3-methyl-5-hydroxy-6-metoxy-1,4-benzoquinol methylase